MRCLPVQLASSIADVGRYRASKLFEGVAKLWSLARILWSFRPNVVYFTLPPEGFAFYLGFCFVVLVRCFGISRVLHMHGGGVARGGRGARKPMYKAAFRNARVIILSERVYNDVAKFVPYAQIRILPNGIPDAAGAAIQRPDNSVPVILFLSHLVETKGPLVLLESLARLQAQNLRFRATFAGAPHGNLNRETFNELASRLGVQDCVQYIGPVFGEAKERCLREADILVLPTLLDAFPGALLEAECYSLPVVSTDIGAIPDIVVDGETGYIVPKGDAAKLADALADLIANPSLRTKFGMNGRARFLEKFQLSRFEESLGRIWADAIQDVRA